MQYAQPQGIHSTVLNVVQGLSQSNVTSITRDSKGFLWIGTQVGLNRYDGYEFKKFKHKPSDTTSLSNNFVNDILATDGGNLWIGTNNGLNRYNRGKDHVIWVGTWDEGLYLFDREKDSVGRITSENSNLPSNSIQSLYRDSHDPVWIGTDHGVARYNLQERSFHHLKINGSHRVFYNNIIYSILEDDRGNLWLSSIMGLTKFRKNAGTFLNFDVFAGLRDYEFNHLAAFKAGDGEMFFGGNSGLNAFYPDSILRSVYIPNIEITSVEIVTNETKHTYDYNDMDSLTVPYGNNFITIEFASLDLFQPSRNQYAYLMQGIENEWVEIGNRRYVTFTNLPPGEYVFRVKGTNNDQIWNQQGESLHILVETTFWRNELAYVTYGIVAISLILLIIIWRIRRLKKAQQQMKEREEFTRQLSRQKEELTIKNKNITDSLTYAKRIQEALLPSDKTLKNLLPHSFVLYKPKDIVSGDFYWINEKNDKLFLAVVDCTGHGVPGAFMSIIGVELLDNIINDQEITEADQILYELNKGISMTLSKEDDSRHTIHDGMDIAFCVVDKKNRQLEFAGAFRPIYLLQDNKIEEIKGDRFSVGMKKSMNEIRITKRKIPLDDSDMIYLFTDGYADQFGGPEGKKYKYRRFRHLLLTIHKLPMEQQKTYLRKSIEDWMGNQEQVDDILVVGFNPQKNR